MKIRTSLVLKLEIVIEFKWPVLICRSAYGKITLIKCYSFHVYVKTNMLLIYFLHTDMMNTILVLERMEHVIWKCGTQKLQLLKKIRPKEKIV